jgi:hypothetical protein
VVGGLVGWLVVVSLFERGEKNKSLLVGFAVSLFKVS